MDVSFWDKKTPANTNNILKSDFFFSLFIFSALFRKEIGDFFFFGDCACSL